MKNSPIFLGIFEGHFNPSVAIVRDGKILAYAEEERFIRLKHANKIYPLKALQYCLDQAGIKPEEVDAIGINMNLPAYSDGEMKVFFSEMADKWSLDENTIRWQQFCLGYFNLDKLRQRHETQWRHAFGKIKLPPVHPIPHHYTHALHAYSQSSFDNALCITIDGSGDQHCTVLWHCKNELIQPIRTISMPHSLGWYYAAFTEYIGFHAYNGEYKLMGLAAYGHPNEELQHKVRKILTIADDEIEYRLNPKYIHYGHHTWSDRFTDDLVELFGQPRRLGNEPITNWHEDLAYAVQQELEGSVVRLVKWGMKEIKTNNLCVGGGVGLNVKMNSKLFSLDCVKKIFVQPLCDDGGAAAGAALGAYWQNTGKRPEILTSLALGPEQSDETIQRVLDTCLVSYTKVNDIAESVAVELANGKIVGWFQGKMEAGPRALGQRSILADPRDVRIRDKINGVVKYREYWRPFCPSIPYEDAEKYFKDYTDSPFMNIAFEASEKLINDAPAIVHVDGTVRVQLVHKEHSPQFHSLLKAFERKTGIPILLNTSFNLKGEPIVCSFSDALRTFFSSGMEVLAAGNFIIKKKKYLTIMKNLKMLIIAPHPDDSILGAGGTMARFIKNGGEVTVLTIAAHKPPLFSEEVFQKTIEEAKKALSLIGVKESIFKNIPALSVNKLEPHELNGIILDEIQRISPDILLIPYMDRNIDHSVIFKSAMVASRPTPTEKGISIIAAYEIISSTHFNAPYIEPNFTPNWVVDISEYINIKIDALRCCESQLGNMPHPRSYEASKALALFRGSQSGMAYGEGFYIIRMTMLPESLN